MRLNSIRLRLIGLVLAAGIPFIFLIGFGLWSQWQTAQAQAVQRAFSDAAVLAAQVDDHIGNIENLLTGLSLALSTNPADTAANDELLSAVKAKQPRFISNILIFSLDGANIGKADGKRFSAFDRDYFQRVLANEAFVIGEPTQSRGTSEWVFPIAVPVIDRAGRMQAVLAVGTLLNKFETLLRISELPSGSVVRIVNESGKALLSSANRPVAPNQIPHDVDPNGSNEFARWSDGITRITGSAATHRAKWMVSVGLPTEVASAAVAARFKESIIFSLSTIVAALVVAWTLSGRIIRPLRQLGRDVSELSAGNLRHRTKIRSSDEVGALAQAFNKMASSLEQRQIEALRNADEVRQAKDTLSAVIDASPVAIACSDLNRKMILWNRAAERIYGYLAEEVLDHSVKMVPPDKFFESRTLYNRAVSGDVVRDVETTRIRKDGSRIEISLGAAPLFGENGVVRGVAWVHQDITDRKRAEEQLKRLAHLDPLTGLANRLAMKQQLADLFSLNPEGSASIALFDLDGFKDVNDTLGHSAGDQLLVEVGRRLKLVSDLYNPRPNVYRLGGDEFVIILPDCGDPLVVGKIVDAMLTCLAEPFDISGDIIHPAGSAGIAIAPSHGTTVDDLISHADLALYQAKNDGGRIYRIFTPALRASANSRRMLDLDLRQALLNNEFELYYQPQIRLSDNAVVGAEALLRWRHPSNGILAPAQFIDALAKHAIAFDVGNWVVKAACAQFACWRSKGFSLNRIAVNLFAANLQSASFADDVQRVLAECELAPQFLELEITENIALNQHDAVRPLQVLREKGVQVAFDDFGTGYSSLSYLTHFPITRIKIDRSFVSRAPESTQDAAIVRALIAIAANLGLDVIAEGVETDEQAFWLSDERCNEAQGFLYSKPLTAAEFENYLTNAHFSRSDAGIADARRA